MSRILIFGHKNPDTDSICSALVYEEMKKQAGIDAVAVRLGDVNDETKYALNYANVAAPKEINSVEGEQVILVDHNEFNQSAENIEQATILEVIDHHRIDNFRTDGQVYMNVQPVGCTSTILYQIAKINEFTITKEMAILMISAIISDSLLFKSPTCTKLDEQVANELAIIAELDLNVYGMELLKAGTNLADYSSDEIIDIDAKEFLTENGKFIVAQVNTANIDDFLEEFEVDCFGSMNNSVEQNNLDLFILMVTDIINSDSMILVQGTTPKVFERSFDVKLKNNKVLLNNVVSRKKQIVPFL